MKATDDLICAVNELQEAREALRLLAWSPCGLCHQARGYWTGREDAMTWTVCSECHGKGWLPPLEAPFTIEQRMAHNGVRKALDSRLCGPKENK